LVQYCDSCGAPVSSSDIGRDCSYCGANLADSTQGERGHVEEPPASFRIARERKEVSEWLERTIAIEERRQKHQYQRGKRKGCLIGCGTFVLAVAALDLGVFIFVLVICIIKYHRPIREYFDDNRELKRLLDAQGYPEDELDLFHEYHDEDGMDGDGEDG
jgi:hypothetical protein